MNQERVTKFETGAVRSSDREGERYDLISPIGLRRLAQTCHEGAVKYSDFNWERGMPVRDILNHAIAHIYAYLSGDRSEDHLAHLAWNAFAACHSEELWPHLNAGTLRGPGCTPPAKGTVTRHEENGDAEIEAMMSQVLDIPQPVNIPCRSAECAGKSVRDQFREAAQSGSFPTTGDLPSEWTVASLFDITAPTITPGECSDPAFGTMPAATSRSGGTAEWVDVEATTTVESAR